MLTPEQWNQGRNICDMILVFLKKSDNGYTENEIKDGIQKDNQINTSAIINTLTNEIKKCLIDLIKKCKVERTIVKGKEYYRYNNNC